MGMIAQAQAGQNLWAESDHACTPGPEVSKVEATKAASAQKTRMRARSVALWGGSAYSRT